MTNVDIIRAWKDEEYRLGLTEAERAAVPDNPAGFVELSDAEMAAVIGGQAPGQIVLGGLVLSSCTTGSWFCNSAICPTGRKITTAPAGK